VSGTTLGVLTRSAVLRSATPERLERKLTNAIWELESRALSQKQRAGLRSSY
jgi:hypothetical protein